MPLILLLHGSGRDATSIISPWERFARQERIALVAPDSAERPGWNIGQDGPSFLYRLVEAVRGNGRIDARRMYLFGHSAGGHHAIDMGLLESEYFAAVAVHAGALTHDEELMTMSANRKIPIAMWNGTDDRIVPLGAVRKSRDYLVTKGFDVTLNEVFKQTHDYYSRAGNINKEAWAFLQKHRLPADPKYKEYVITK